MDELEIATISKRSVHGVLALISRQFLVQIASTASALVVYTFLTPHDVGVYTAVIAFQRLISFFTDFGFGAALVQKKEEVTREDVKTIFTLQACTTFFVFLLVFIFRESISEFFQLDKSGQGLMLALVFTIFLSSFKTIPSILLERDIKFNRLIIPQILEQLTFYAILTVLVLMQFGLTSYTWAFLISGIISIPVYFFVARWRPGLGIYRESLKSLTFGIQFQAKNILATVKDDFLTVILTRFLTFTEIGYIGFAQRIAFLVYRYVVDSVTKVTFSSYSRIQDNMEHLRTAIEKSLFFVSLAMFPALVGTMVVFPSVIEYLPRWNGKWEPAVISLIFFCMNAMISSLSGILVNVLDATGRVRTTLKLMTMWTALTWILTPLGIHFLGYNGVAFASFLVSLTIVITVYLLKRVVDFNFLRSITKPSIATLTMLIVLLLLRQFLISDFLTLSIAVALAILTYTAVIYLLAKDQILKDIRYIRSKP